MRAVTLWCVSLTCLPLCAQEAATPVIRTTTREVLLDVVVRDRKERAIRNLRPDEVRVLEDGIPQKVTAFRFTDTGADEQQPPVPDAHEPRPSARGANPQAPPLRTPALNPLHNLNIVTVVFERMGPRSRLFAQQAAAEFLANEFHANTLGGVFSLDYRLNALQPYTNNQDLLRRAIARATTGNYTEFRKDSENVLNNLAVEVSSGRAGITIGTAGGDPYQSSGAATQGAESPGLSSDGQMAIARLVWKQMGMVTYGAGWRSLDGLRALVEAQEALPGRKTVLLLSEGLVVPWEAEDMFRAVIDAANRARVSIYCVDVTGLSIHSPARAGTDLLRTGARISANQNMGVKRNGDTNSADENMDMFHQDDTVGMSLHANPQAAMGELAESTGGFLIANTNDIARPLHRVMEDVRAHYELSYVPTSQNYDGHFRKIEVQVARAGAQVQTRSGYFALPTLAGDVLQPFEMTALNALNTQPLPKAFLYRAQALLFRAEPDSVQYAVVFQVPLENLSYRENKQTAKLRTHISLLALIKDAAGQIAAKVSRDLANDIPADKFDDFTRGDLTFAEPVSLAPGRYTLETAVVDQENGAASVRRSALVASDQTGVSLSELVPVRRVDPLDDPRDPADPLEFAGGKVTPSLDTRFAAGSDIPLYMVVYPLAAGPRLRLTMEVFENGRRISSTSPDLPAPDQFGVIPFMSSIRPDPGQYEVRVTLRQGASSASRMIALRVQ
ncbi:MAG TPA: VWA domain-containing protein [Bryobacteraceae bacterium]|nr:VWA domain-containing protein [Bryobacteraceae bacterium]